MVATGIERFFGGLVGVLGGSGAMYLAETVRYGDWLYPDRGPMFWAAVVTILAGLALMVWGVVTTIIGIVASKRKKKFPNAPRNTQPAAPFSGLPGIILRRNIAARNTGAGFRFGRGATVDAQDNQALDNEGGGFVVEGEDESPKP